MKFTAPLIEGKILRRYKRFFTDVELPSGEVVVAHTPNTGSMKTCLAPGMTGLLSPKTNPERKLPFTLEMTGNGKTLIGVNTSMTNYWVEEALKNKKIKELAQYSEIKREHKINAKSRIDFLLEGANLPHCLLEIKNVTLREENGQASFPDAVTERGQKHLQELMTWVREGKMAAMLYVIPREDVDSFGPADNIDPVYGKLLREAKESGVLILAYQCHLTKDEIAVKKALPLTF